MVTVIKDPANPDRLVVTVTVTAFIDKICLETLSDEIENAIRDRAIKDLRKSRKVKAAISGAASQRLLDMLGVKAEVSKAEKGEKDANPAEPKNG